MRYVLAAWKKVIVRFIRAQKFLILRVATYMQYYVKRNNGENSEAHHWANFENVLFLFFFLIQRL